MRLLPKIDQLPYALYRAEQVRQFDRIAIDDLGISGIELMEKAGKAIFEFARSAFPDAKHWSVVCGLGNNGGDGYVVARLAREAGLDIELLQLGDFSRVKGDALHHLKLAEQAGIKCQTFSVIDKKSQLIVDAVFGTGLDRDITGDWLNAINAINRHRAPVVSADIPSGLNSDNGSVMGGVVTADSTVTFIGLKQGMFTAEGPARCGQIIFDGLDVPARVYASSLLAARRIDWLKLQKEVEPRSPSAHKGDFGHVLVIGGAPGFSGAARLAAEGALFSGAGLVSVATHPNHASVLNVGRPELMCHGVSNGEELKGLIEKAGVIAIGPGLSQTEWGCDMLQTVLTSGKPMVVDADALNLLSIYPKRLANAVITPHPGEAARLLGLSSQQVQQNRFDAVERLRQHYAPVVVLKGAGSLIAADGNQPVGLCSEGNPGMAVGGMGDVLTGMIAAFVAQGRPLQLAAELGVVLHAAAGDMAATEVGEIGLLPSDVIGQIRKLQNNLSSDDVS